MTKISLLQSVWIWVQLPITNYKYKFILYLSTKLSAYVNCLLLVNSCHLVVGFTGSWNNRSLDTMATKQINEIEQNDWKKYTIRKSIKNKQRNPETN